MSITELLFLVPYLQTYVGDILLAVNPFKELQIYSAQVSRLYAEGEGRRSHPSLPPHVFACAERAIQAAHHDQSPLTFILSGESGSGKTTACRHILQHLLTRAEGSSATHLESTFKHVNCILKVFGEVPNSTNSTSSCFSAFLELLLRRSDSKVIGGRLTTYLLERSRVLASEGQPTFPIFSLLSATEGLEKLDMRNQGNSENCWSSQASHAGLADVVISLRALGLSAEDESSLLSLLRGIWLLTKIRFQNVEPPETSRVSSPQLLEQAAAALLVPSAHLESALTTDVTCSTGKSIMSCFSSKMHHYIIAQSDVQCILHHSTLTLSEISPQKSILCHCPRVSTLRLCSRMTLPGPVTLHSPFVGLETINRFFSLPVIHPSLPSLAQCSLYHLMKERLSVAPSGVLLACRLCGPVGRSPQNVKYNFCSFTNFISCHYFHLLSFSITEQPPSPTIGDKAYRRVQAQTATTWRDQLACSLYARTFGLLIQLANLALRSLSSPDSYTIIGVLDVPGLSEVQDNGYEQLCTRLLTERLGEFGLRQLFHGTDKDVEARDGVGLTMATLPGDSSVPNAILQIPLRPLTLPDSNPEPRGTERESECWTKGHLSRQDPNGNSPMSLFTISHFSSTVIHDLPSSAERSGDRLPLGLLAVMKGSGNSVIQKLFMAKEITFDSSLGSGNDSIGQGGQCQEDKLAGGHADIISYFRAAALDILARLSSATPMFIRCIRPNGLHLPGVFDSTLVAAQLRRACVLESVQTEALWLFPATLFLPVSCKVNLLCVFLFIYINCWVICVYLGWNLSCLAWVRISARRSVSLLSQTKLEGEHSVECKTSAANTARSLK
uniref:Myosin motor domain-containing protein n=1 Tax=Eptatretus burgeri TaxID=7764 RepID=A0A8C4WNL0_EPTBU